MKFVAKHQPSTHTEKQTEEEEKQRGRKRGARPRPWPKEEKGTPKEGDVSDQQTTKPNSKEVRALIRQTELR